MPAPDVMEGTLLSRCSCSQRLPDGQSWCSCSTRHWPLDWSKCTESDPESLPGGASLKIAMADASAKSALRNLFRDDDDRVLAIDLEWKPDTSSVSNNRVAVVSIASGTTVVLILTALRDFTLPPALKSLIRDPSITWIGQGWAQNDEKKFRHTFGLGRADFAGTFLDLQDVARLHGMPTGLDALAARVLGVQLDKSQSRSNWEARRLSPSQLVYAALDSLAAGAIYRALRAKHAGIALPKPRVALPAAKSAAASGKPTGSGSVWPCRVCNITCCSEGQLQDHLNGRKHKLAAAAAPAAPAASSPLGAGPGFFCRICNISCPNANILQHLQGKRHRAAVARGSALPPRTQTVISTPAPAATRAAPRVQQPAPRAAPSQWDCTLCGVYCRDAAQLRSHEKGRLHLEKVIKSVAESRVLTRNGIQLTLPPSPIQLRPKEVKAVDLTLENKGSMALVLRGSSVMFVAAGQASEETVKIVDGATTLEPGRSYVVKTRFVLDAPTSRQGVVSFDFETFQLAGVLTLQCSSAEYDKLAPTAPYRPPPNIWPKEGNVVAGEKPPGTGNKLPRRPPSMDRAVGYLLQLLESNDAAGLDRYVGPPSTDTAGVARRFQTLLVMEFYQHEQDILQYSMDDARLETTKGGNLLSLRVPGLAECRPSVLRGDSIIAKAPSDIRDTRDWEGYVHIIELDRVLLKFHPSFHAKHMNGTKYAVRFTVPDSQFRFINQALDQAVERPPAILLPITVDTVAPIPFPGGGARSLLSGQGREAALNPEQLAAVDAIGGGAGRGLPYLIFGPPGTGKTTTMVAGILRVLREQSNARILVCAPSNEAANVVAERILASHPKSEVLRMFAYSVDKATVSDTLLAVSNYDRGTDSFQLASPERILRGGLRVVVTTLLMSIKLFSNGLDPGSFTQVFVDEAGHADEPLCLAPIILHATPPKQATTLLAPAPQVILSGDPQQLGPIILSSHAKRLGLGTSLLERLMSAFPYARNELLPTHYDPRLLTKLVRNYRSHPDILKVPNELFYNGELVACADPFMRSAFVGWDRLPNPKVPLIFHSVQGQDEREGNSPSWFNRHEIEVAVGYVSDILQRRTSPVKPEEIGIVTPYHKQKRKFEQILVTKFGSEIGSKIKVGSVELFQGQERKVIIISTVRSSAELVQQFDLKFKLGFVANPKRLNVAVTRAKSLLIVVGNATLLNTDPNWEALITHCRDLEAFRGTPPPSAQGPGQNGSILSGLRTLFGSWFLGGSGASAPAADPPAGIDLSDPTSFATSSEGMPLPRRQ